MFILRVAPEPHGAIRIGLEHLQNSCPSEMPKALKTSEGDRLLGTAGDYFAMADRGFGSFTTGTLVLLFANLVISIWFLITNRSNKPSSSEPAATKQ